MSPVFTVQLSPGDFGKRYFDENGEVDFEDTSITQNTRVSYPIEHIQNIMVPSIGKNKNIFFLTGHSECCLNIPTDTRSSCLSFHQRIYQS